MVKILKTMQPKHKETLSPYVREFVLTGSTLPLRYLPSHLSKFPTRWPFPRGDLYHWIPLLNRFDTILEEFCNVYGLSKGPQTKEFGHELLEKDIMESSEFAQGLTEPNYEDDGDREVVETILNFSRILLENCGNRSIYASSPHLSDLLNSTSLTLIASTLHIGTQLAQRYQASFKRISGSHRQANAALLMNHYNIDLERVLQLAQPFSRIIIPEAAAATVPTTPATPNPKGKDKAYFSIPATPAKVAPVTVYANDLVSMVRGGTSARGSPKGMTAASAPTHSASSENDWKAWLDVHLAYHVPPQQGEPEGTTALNTSQSAPATPTPIRRSSTLGQAHTQRSNRASTSDETATTTPSRSSTFQAATDVAKSPNLKVVDVPAVEDANINSLIAGYLHSVPDSTHYTLLQKLRVAYAMADSLETRRQILAVRILAITNLAYIYTEPIFLDKVLKQDSEEPRRLQLIYQLAELIHPPAEGDIGVPRYLQTIALNALEALAQHQSKYQDICTALNTNVNHGVLLYIVRKAVAEMSVDEQGNVLTEKDEWRTALFSLLTHVATLPRAGNELVTAGLVPILVEVLTLRTTIAQHNWPKILSFLDAIVFNVRDAFQVLVNAEGLDALSSLIVYEVDSASARAEAGEGMPEDFRSPAIDYDIPYFQQQSIKWLFKFIHHMMNTAGGYGTNFDRLLRNLIDSPQLLGSLRQIIGHSKRFGATAWTNAVSILNDFINNEPTSFAVIAEAGLSRGVLEAVTGREITVTDVPNQPQSSSASRNEASSPAQTDDEDLISFDTDSDDTAPHPPTREMLQTPRPGRLAQGIMPSPEAIIIIPEAFGAICLNSAGMRMFMKSDALRSFFEIFESRSHIKAFDNDSSLATTLGSTFDELVRHHPPLKAAIMNAVLDMVARVSHLCKTRLEAEKEGAKLWATNSNGELVVSDDCLSTSAKGKEKAASTDLDVQMSGVGDTFTTSTDAAPSEEDSNANITPYVSAVALFLVAMFNNSGIRTIFMEKGGMEYILDLAELPILPYSVSDERASRHLHTVIALLAEQKTHLVIPSLIKRVQTATDTLAEFTQYNDPESYFGKFVKDASVSNEPEVNARLASGRGLVVAMMKVHNLITSLRSCIQPPVYTRSSTLTFTAMNLADLYIKLVNSLGPLLGATIREDFKMTKLVPQHWKRAARSRDGSIPPKDFVEPSYPTIDSSADTLQSVLQDGSAPITTLTSESAARPPPAAPASQSLSSAERKSAEFRNFQTLRYLLAKVPIVIPTFFQALGKALVSKRNPDAFQRQCNALIADALAETVLSQLNFPKDDTSGESYTYWVLMLGAVKDLLVNSSRHTERPKECITIVLQAFKQRKGFDTINRILGVFGVEIKKNADKTISASDADILLRNDLATLGMKHILDLYLSLSNGKNIAEATQTSLMASRSDREKNSSNYFSPAQFLIELRMAVLPVVRELWESSIVEKGSKIIPSRLIEIIRTIALADHEGGAFRRADHLGLPVKAKRRLLKVNAEARDKLKAQAYSDDLACEALFRCHNNFASALEYCKAQQDEHCGGRNPVPEDDIDKAEAPGSSSHVPTGSSTGASTPSQSAMQVDNSRPASSHEMAPPPPPAQIALDQLAEEDPAAQLQSLLSGISRSFEEAIAGPPNGPESSVPSQPSPTTTAGSQKGIVTVEDLDEERAKIRENLIERCLDIINTHTEFTFEIADLITTVVDKSPDPANMRSMIAETLVNALTSFVYEEDVRIVGKKVAAYAHLLALMLQDKPFYNVSVHELKQNIGNLLQFVKLSPDHKSEESSPWISHILLIIEILLSDDAQPRETDWKIPTSESSPIVAPVFKKIEHVVSDEQRVSLFESIIEILPRIGKDESLALAVLRILVILTRSRSLAQAMGEKKNIQRLFLMAKQLAGATSVRLQSPLMLILRHIIEDDETIKQIMRSEIKAFFDSGRTPRHLDVGTYVRQLSNLVIRQPELFVEVSSEMVRLSKWSSSASENPIRQQIELQSKFRKSKSGKTDDTVLPTLQVTEELSLQDVKPSTEPEDKDMTETSKPSMESKAPVIENPDGVIHFLLCELINYRDVEDQVPQTDKTTTDAPGDNTESSSPTSSTAEPTASSVGKDAKKTKQEFKPEEHPIYIYRCFLLQCLTELLSSYNRTKIEFINFKRSAPPQAMTPSKPRSNVLNYLLFDLIPSGTLENAETTAIRKKLATSSWADSVITALLSKTGEQLLDRDRDILDLDDEPDLLFVRKFVLENILKAYKEAAASSESLDAKYSRMLSLADLMTHIMSGKDNHGGGTDPGVTPHSVAQLKRIMFEKGYIAALTASIADIDLNFPGAKRAVKHILRPLKALTQTAIELSELGKVVGVPGQVDEEEIASASSVDEIDDEREETPDLFRNSTLGMFEPDRDHESSSESEDDDEEMYDDDGYDDEEMADYDGPEDDEDNISDEEDIEGMGEIEGLDGDHGVDVEVLMEGDEHDDDDEDDDEDDEDETDEDDEDSDMDDDDEDDRVEIMDEDGNIHQMGELDEEDEWDSEDEEADYEGRAADQAEEDELHEQDEMARGNTFGRLVGHDGEINTLLQRIEDGHVNADTQMELDEYLEGGAGDEDEDEDEEDEEEMEDEDDIMYEEFAHPAMPFEWNGDGDEPAMVITHRGHRPRHGIPNHFPFFPGGPRDPLGGTSALSNTPASALQPLAVIISQLDSQMEAVLFSNNRTNPLPVPEYRGSYRSHRPGPTPRGNDDGTNPLLQRASGSRGSDSGIHSLARSRGDNLFDMGLTRPIPFGENPASLLNDIITSLPLPGNLARNGQAIHFQFTNGPRGVIGRDIPAMFGMTQTVPRYDGRGSNVEPGHAAFFTPQLTATRWSEEAKLLFGPAHPDKALPVIMSLMAAIVPAALKEEIKANQERKAAEERKKREEEERLEKQKKEAEEKAAKEKKEAEEREAAEKARAEEVAASAAAENNEENQVEETDTEAMEGVVVETGATASLEDVPAADRPRVTTEIRGAIIDITDLGIDPEFLQELPEDIREEVITAAVAERRSQQAASGAQPSEIDQEFLDALPDEIRDEIMQQERQDRRRREREEARRQAVANGGPAIVVPQEMDAASILATLPPELRAQVLAEQDDDVLAQLPPEYVAQARAAMREHPLSHVRQMATFGGRARPPTAGGTDQASAKQPRRSIVQMLDKPGVATLLRLMFIFQQDSLRNSLFHVLQNISENRHNRAEVISTLLHILQDGSADMTAVERSFAHLSLRAKQPKDKEKEPKTPQLKRTLTGATSTSLITNTEISPLMVVQQCLSALIYLCKVNPHIPSFFLSEHESSTSGLKRSLSRKGKAKESRAAKFALNSLLSLLDRKLIMESSPVMESLSDLLSRITAPLQALERKQKEAAEEVSKAAQAAVEPQAVAVEATADATLTIGSTDAMDTTEPSTATPATETTSAPAVDDAETSTVNADAAEPQASAGKEPEPKKTRPFQAPIVPDANLKLVINIFVARECSAKTFRETLSTIKNLSCIPDAKAVFGRELIRKAQELGEVILGDLEELLPQIQKASTGTEIQGVALTKFSPSGSDQNKLLRVLTALDHLFEPKHSVKRDGEGGTEGESISDKDTEKQDLLASLYENSTFGPMWDKLSACLSAIRQREHMLNVATILLPLIESLMVVCKNTTLKEQPATRTGKDKLLMSPVPESRMENLFFTFTEEHRKILNDLVRNTPKLMSGTFSLLVKNPKVLEFDNKRNYFTRSIHNRNNPSRQSYPPLQISVQRKKVFHDSFRSLYFKTAEEMKYGKLSIRFHGEEGVDAGGVTREWFQVLSRQMFDPDYALFIPVSSDRTTFHPNLMSGINDEHLLFFKFIGRVIGKALYEGRVLDCHFSRPVYKRILGKPVSIKDMESLDPEYYKSLVWMLENDITDIITETFSADNDKFGAVETVDLIENGRNIPVTQENKHEYVRLMVEFKLTGSVQEQLDNFLKGFHEIIPAELVAIFNEQELELLISGLPEIDVDDWKANTEYHNYTAASPQIQWFWRAIRSFDKEERAKLLQFVTGTSKVPLNGFKELEGMNGFTKFNIHRDYGNKDRLPSSHTCFNQLDLPEYESYETLRQQLLTAITAGSDYFGFA